MKTVHLAPIGVVRSTRKDVYDDHWDREAVAIELDPTRFTAEALAGITAFSHVEVLFYMDRVDPGRVETAARHPRNNPAWPRVGVFAQRGKNRPNPIGATICRVVGVEGTRLVLHGLDAVDGSPVLDIKPWVQEFGPRGEVSQPAWISELMEGYWEAAPPDAKR